MVAKMVRTQQNKRLTDKDTMLGRAYGLGGAGLVGDSLVRYSFMRFIISG